MQNNDLKQIKKKYGENMAHLCRELFPSILEQSGRLLEILENNFDHSRFLYDDLVSNNLVTDFKNFVFSKNIKELETKEKTLIVETPEELMKKVGYILKECKTEEEIQAYKKYYIEGEELCTFQGKRLERCRVFFAVKENVEEIKREKFTTPKRQDKYGTSVISIQFTKDGTNMLSIKNRYNHTVADPDATFSNDLENIISGLTSSFE